MMYKPQLVTFSPPPGDNPRDPVNLVGATILVDAADFPGVRIAAATLADDFGRVTKDGPSPLLAVESEFGETAVVEADVAIIIGTVESSALVRKLVSAGQIDIDGIRGRWESFCTAVVERPACAANCRRALVVAGSDKRGAIFGAYTLSEQIGVSPWYWWADVPTKYHKEVYALPVVNCSREPSVRYRGIFINDESPALTGLVLEKFGRYGKEFHERVFELLLRLKFAFTNYKWPGYPNPGSSFFVDDPDNQKTAEDYGIVMSTSHHEPMQRATNEWFEDNPDGSWNWLTNKAKVTQFFDEGLRRAEGRESYFTMGMRGEYDRSIKVDDPPAVISDVIRTQRSLIKGLYGREDAVPQLLALYKEVQEHWDSGKLEVPDDVTLLFADDNFGSIRRLPSGSEINRSGGAGIYYHFEYVGVPRSYKWINPNSLGKTWHQLHEAHRRNAKQIWVFNVGDIKPMEVPLSFAMAMAWDIESIPADSFHQFFTSLAEREFGTSLAEPVASAWHEYDRLVSLRRHEHIEADSFSLLHNDEANTILTRWSNLLRSVETLYESKVSENLTPVFFQLVLHPIKASTIYVSLRINQARNQLWAQQRRNTANKAAREVLDLFDADFTLSEEFHSLLEGKWDQIMRQTHYGYSETWHAPSRDMISGLCFVQTRQDSNPLVGQLGVAVEGHAGVRPGVCNEESDRTHPSRRDLVPGVTLGGMTPYGPESRWFEIYTRGTKSLNWYARAPHDWIRLSRASGRLVPGQEDVRVHVTVDWDRVPIGFDAEVLIDVGSTGGNYGPYGDDFEQIHLPVIHRRLETPFTGFVETIGYVSIPATTAELSSAYRVLPEVGRSSIGSVALIPSEMDGDIPFLTYKIYVFTESEIPALDLQFNMTLDLDPTNPMEYDVRIDNEPLQTHRLVTEPEKKGDLPPVWFHAVQDCVWHRRHDLGALGRGEHEISVRLKHSNVILEKLVLDLGGAQSSYLGPPPSMFCRQQMSNELFT